MDSLPRARRSYPVKRVQEIAGKVKAIGVVDRNFTYDSKERVPIKEYTSLQRRFRHLDDSEIDKLQEQIEERWSNLVSISQAKI